MAIDGCETLRRVRDYIDKNRKAGKDLPKPDEVSYWNIIKGVEEDELIAADNIPLEIAETVHGTFADALALAVQRDDFYGMRGPDNYSADDISAGLVERAIEGAREIADSGLARVLMEPH